MKHKQLITTLTAALCVAGLSGPAVAVEGPVFTGIGHLPGDVFISTARAVSDDGNTVVGWAYSEAGGEAIRWHWDDGIKGLGDFPGGPYASAAWDVSEDGSVIVGYGYSAANRPYAGQWGANEAFRWTEEEGMVGLGDLPDPPFGSQALGVSADGSVIAGSGDYFFFPGETSLNDLGKAFRWTEETGMVSLGDMPGQTIHSNAYDISADGSVVVGYAGFPLGEAFRWTASTGIVGLGGLLSNDDYPLNGGIHSVASAVSADGATVVGRAASFDEGGGQGWEAFRWTTVTGTMVGLGDLPGGSFYSVATGVSGDGGVVVGSSSSDSSSDIGVEPFVWTESQGMLPLADVLRNDFGLDLGQWVLARAHDISQDGLVIVGHGYNPEGNLEGWIVCLRDECFEEDDDDDEDEDDDDDDDHGGKGYRHHGDKGKGHRHHDDD